MSCTEARRRFTEAAREAAALARQRRREIRARSPEQLEFALEVVRAPDRPMRFGWQIRRFGHVEPVARSPDAFDSPSDAGRSGQYALAALREAAAAAR